MVNLRRLACVMGLMLSGLSPGVLAAERQLYWDALDVDARLEADGVLQVAERHVMVFTGDWNGGERVFNVRPRQKLEFLGMERLEATTDAEHALDEAPVPDEVDEFSWADARTLRWRSRLPSDPPFASSTITYVLHYKLAGALLKDEKRYQLDHDFAFPVRAGPIARFSLSLALDPVWQPQGEVRERYTAGPLDPGRGFVLTIPLRYSGTGVPSAIDSRRPREIVGAVTAILGLLALGIVGFFVRERSLGRFARVPASSIDRTWIEQQILAHEAEVVGAAWDGRIGTPEVVALIARMTGEGKLESEITGVDSMTLRLKVDRSTLDAHELSLVNGLFFDDRTETSTSAVKRHYKGTGFDPAAIIKPYLQRRVESVLPPGDVRVWWLPGAALILAGALLLAWSAYAEPRVLGAAIEIAFAFVVLAALAQLPGRLFRARIDWGVVAAALFMIPALLVSLGTAAFLWLIAGTGRLELPLTMIGAITAWAIYISNAWINGMKSRQNRDAIAFRKRLAAGRQFFLTELAKPNPVLRDGWYPWLLSFGLGKQMDAWSTLHTPPAPRPSTGDRSSASSRSSPGASTSHAPWSGGGGGRSGGAGASGAWAAAATGMAAGVAVPSSSGSGGGSSGGSSSGGGSSGGGGGGGW